MGFWKSFNCWYLIIPAVKGREKKMEQLGAEIMSMIERFGEIEFRNQLDIIMNRNQEVLSPRQVANARIAEYMKMTNPVVYSGKRPVKNVIITSPTQVGKTQYMIDGCKRNENEGELIVISCDNSLVQMGQLKNRLEEAGVCHYTLAKSSPSVVGGLLKVKKTVVIVMLNNATQISKLSKLINDVGFVCNPTRYIFFHDEADMLNKSDDISELTDSAIPISHRSWVSLMNLLENTKIPVNRFWISATPENCSLISRIFGADIFVLPDDENYCGVSDFTPWSCNDETPLEYEINRIRDIGVEFSGEVILYCVDKKNIEQDKIARELSIKYKCVTCSYNMKGLVLYFDGRAVNGIIRKNDSISVVLDKTRGICRDENAPMIVVGYNLMSRGVSFVAQGDNPPTATVMFYSGGVDSHIIGIAQRLGRITGTSRTDLTRRIVYCNSGVYEDYTNYLENQKLVWDSLSCVENRSLDICKILIGCGGARLNRPIDRPGLVSVNSAFRKVGENRGGRHLDEEWDEDKMRRLVDSWKVESNNTAVATLFRRMIGNGGRMESRLVRESISRTNYDAMTNSNTSLKWSSVFRKDEMYHYVKDEALEYLG